MRNPLEKKVFTPGEFLDSEAPQYVIYYAHKPEEYNEKKDCFDESDDTGPVKLGRYDADTDPDGTFATYRVSERMLDLNMIQFYSQMV